MFGDAWTQFLAVVESGARPPGRSARAAAPARPHHFDYSVADLARHQVMDERVLPDFVPSEEAYAPSLAVMQRLPAG